MESPVGKIAAQQPEFPELIGNIFAHIGDRAIRPHDHLGRVVRFSSRNTLVVFAAVVARLEIHHPAAGIFSRAREVNRPALFQLLKCGLPEFQVQDFALSRQQIILHPEPLHGTQMAPHNRDGDEFRQLRGGAVAFFDGRERLRAQPEPRLVFLEKLRDPRIEVPAEVIEARSCRQRAHFVGGLFLQVCEPDHHVRHLHAGVVDIILHFDAPSRAPQQAHKRVAEGRIAQMPDVRGFIGVDVGVLDHAFRLAGGGFSRRAPSGPRGFRKRRREKCRAIEEEIDVARAREFRAGHSGNRREFRGDLLRNLPRSAPQPLGQLEGHRRGHFAHGHGGRALRNHGDIWYAAAIQEFAQRRANPRLNDVIHGSSFAGFLWDKCSSEKMRQRL